jgi:hypothetical protein
VWLANSAPAREPAARYAHALGQYAELDPAQRAAWLQWLFANRLQPACRITRSRADAEAALARQSALLARVRAGKALSTDELVRVLQEVDREEAAAIERLAAEYRRVTREAVGTDEWEFQQRIILWEAIEHLCQESPYPFEGQAKLIDWLENAILEQRLSARRPLPRTPDFLTVNDLEWLTDDGDATRQVKTAAVVPVLQLDAGQLAPQITEYNSELAQLVQGLYDPRIRSVDELNATVDRLAQLGLVRIGLAAGLLALPEDQRDLLDSIEPLDTAISLARVRVSAARRQILRRTGHTTRGPQWEELKGLNQLAVRLDTLATGPDR